MFSRHLVRRGRFHRRTVRPVAWAMAGVMGASLIQVAAPPVAAEPKLNRPATTDPGKILPTRDPLPVKPRAANPAVAAASTEPAKVSWPSAGVTDLTVAATAVASRTARSVAPTVATNVGGLPISVSPVHGTTGANRAATLERDRATDAAPGKIRVEVLDRSATEKARVDGPLVRVTRVDGRSASGTVRLGLGYEGIAGAYGGDFGARLRLVQLPECALTAPEKPQCAAVPVPTTNDSVSKTLSAEVRTGALVAMVADDASSQGDYSATKLAPSAKWSVAPSTGGFSWSYPLRTPPVPGNGAPPVMLAYSSQSVDGRTAATNNQGSWIGEGFNYEPGHIERRYNPCSEDGHDQYADQCWAYDNATILLNGRSTELVKSGDTWRFAADDGSKVERLTGAVNGDNNGEYWKVTATDGTEYYFGLNRLPGWTSGKEETKSTWTVPIYGDDAGEPCYDETFTSAHCDQAWRWSLDYVKDRYGNVSSYFYQQEINHYARGARADVNGAPYVRGGWLKRIDYGQRHDEVYATNAPARVRFDTKERCLPSGDIDCDPQDLNDTTAQHWPDVPFDRNCAANTKCTLDQSTPTFWTRARLTGITTEIREGTDWAAVDHWKLDHLLTDNGDGSRTLWLHKITHSGLYGPGADIAMPSVELGGLQLPNRIDRNGDNIAPLVRFRLATVWTDTGGQVDVNYATPDCTQSNLPTPGNSTRRCYPVRWSPLGSGDPIIDWFHKYVVEQVVETDRTGGAPDMVTRYQYLDGAAWRHADPDGITDPEDLTWSDWRGYGRVVVTSGDGQVQPTKTEYRYLRGMHGDKDPDGGTRTVTVTDSTGGTHTDHDEFSGHQVESIVYNGAEVVSKKIETSWRHNTATETHSWGSKKAWFVNTATARNLVALAAGGWRETKQTSTFDTSFGRVIQTEHEGDVAVTGDESCSRTTYADNPTSHLHNVVSRVESVAVTCSATPDRSKQVISDNRTSYDGKAFGEPPTLGNPTRTERLKSHDGTSATYVRASEGTFDEYGRQLTVVDALGAATVMEYTETDGLTTMVKTTNPLQHVTTTDYTPAWGLAVRHVDENGLESELEYDGLGRLVKVWMPDRAGGVDLDPSIRYTYLVRTDKPVAVKTERLQSNRSYSVEYQLYDGLLRPRQAQSEGPDGTRAIADTFYTATGQLAKAYATYTVAGAPTDAIYPAVNGDVNGQKLYVYDGADRVKAEIFAVAGNEKWRTTTTYGGDRVSVDPPTGDTPTITFTNALGKTTELRQYKGSEPSGDFDATTYAYNETGRLETVTGPAGNVWTHEYDQLGRKTTSVDPDAGRSTITYDDLDRITSTTNALGQTISTTYDQIGRKSAVYQGSAETGELLSSWTYDLEMLGHISSVSRWVEGHEYATYYSIYDEFYRPAGTYISVPEHAGAELAGLYTFGTEYNSDGTVQSRSWSDGGGLPFEPIIYTYDDMQRVIAMTGDAAYVTDVDYASTGEVLQTEAVVGNRKVWSTYEYEQGSKRLTRQRLDRAMAPVVDIDARYTYDPAGNISSIANNPSGTRDTQCFTYDYLRRMEQAWTSASAAEDPCAGGPSVTGVGGVAPYHHAYTFDATGSRTTETQYSTSGTSLIERSYSYPAAGEAQPHTLREMTEKTPQGDRLHSYEYDATGNTTKRTKAGEDQTLVWDAEGNLESVTDADGTKTSFLYDVDGSRMLRKEPDATTLYLPDMEIRLDHQSRSTAATRYYPLPGGSTLVRKVDGLRYVANDHHGTGQATIDEAGAITHRRTTPYGEVRGAESGEWPTEKGFVNGNIDSTTGLTNIGAREYDPVTGRFISVDPIIDINDPQQMNGYAYANNNPISYSDPTGLIPLATGGGPEEEAYWKGQDKRLTYDHHRSTWTVVDGYRARALRQNPLASADERLAALAAAAERERQRQLAAIRAKMISAGKELAKIAMEDLGITDGLDCFLDGDVDACVNTVINVATTALGGGALGRLGAKYGLRWKQGYDRGKRVKSLLGDLMKNAKAYFKGCHSFAPGTIVLMADGSTRSIEKLKPGDEVLATDPETGETMPRVVVATHTNLDVELTDLALSTTGGSAVIETTANHPFWSEDRSAWVDAAELRAGERMLTSDGTPVTISKVEPYYGQEVMYDLTVADIHTYYVIAGTTPVLVHNSNGSCGIGRQLIGDKSSDHILEGHRYPGAAGKDAFPEGWSDDQILDAVADVLTSPDSQRTWYKGSTVHADRTLKTRKGEPAVQNIVGSVGGVRILVRYEPLTGKVLTAFPN